MLNTEPPVFNTTGINIECKSGFALFIGHEGPLGEKRYSSTLSRTSALDGGGGFSPTPPAASTLGKDPVPIVQEAGWAPGSVWTGERFRPHRD